MNYLAHAWLSFKHPEILVGNMISDFVKGKKRFEYGNAVQQGIMLHRRIDMFTDEHEATKKAKQFFKPAVGLYAGAFVDVVYDHFLACDENEFTKESLLQFSLFVYAVLDEYETVLPEKFARMLPYMKRDNWLFNYRTLYGTGRSFEGLTHRAKYLENNNTAFEYFQENYEALRDYYIAFFPEVKKFAQEQINLL